MSDRMPDGVFDTLYFPNDSDSSDYAKLYAEARRAREAEDFHARNAESWRILAELTRKRAEEAEARVQALKEETSRPLWTCADCGSGGKFKAIRYDIPGEPVEYDVECPACGGTDARESAEEAAHALGDKLDALRAQVQTLREALYDVFNFHLRFECIDGEQGLPCACHALDRARAALGATKARDP